MMSVVAIAQKLPNQSGSSSYTYSFTQSLNGWTTIDADGDGNTWYILNHLRYPGHDGNHGLVTSASWQDDIVLYPDNYLVSPKIKLDGQITFWANAEDEYYSDEYFGVAVSTSSNTDPSDFTMLEEWEMTASRQLAPRREQGTWYKYEIDLSSFKGAEGYVAIRHFDCSDMFRLNVDDITLTTTELLDDYDPNLEIDKSEIWTFAGFDSDDEAYQKPVLLFFNDKSVSITGIFSYTVGEIIGTLSDDGKSITFASGQFTGVDEDEDMYFMAYDLDADQFLESVTADYDAEKGVIKWPSNVLLANNYGTDGFYSYDDYYYAIAVSYAAPAPQTPPAELEDYAAEYRLNANEISEIPDVIFSIPAFGAYNANTMSQATSRDYSRPIYVVFDDNDVWVKGIFQNRPNGWIKGTIDPETDLATFPTDQCISRYGSSQGTSWDGSYAIEYYFAGYGENGKEDVVMAFNEDTGVFTMVSPTKFIISRCWLLPDSVTEFEDVELVPVPDVAAIPAQPEITSASMTDYLPNIKVNIPIEDEDGNPILTTKLSYQY